METINDFYSEQFRRWPLVKENYDSLLKTERRVIEIGDLRVCVQYNPARVRSTAAKVDDESVANRPCFLCKKNRPEEQLAGESIPDYEILVNPYPILPVHFTIVSKEHRRQDAMPLEMIDFVNMVPETVAFFNGAKAGASAPDHLHFQAVLKEELPLLREIEKRHTPQQSAMLASYDMGEFPMSFVSVIVPPTFEGMQLLSILPTLGGMPDEEDADPRDFVNTFVWMDTATRMLRVVIIPRRRHRPDCYFKTDDSQLMVSPGALDMAGIIVTPRHEDFEVISESDIRNIYQQTGLTVDELRKYLDNKELQKYQK